MKKVKEILKRCSAVILAVLFLITSFGFKLDIHYCHDEYKNFSLFGNAKKCNVKRSGTAYLDSHFDCVKPLSCCSGAFYDLGLASEIKDDKWQFESLEKFDITSTSISETVFRSYEFKNYDISTIPRLCFLKKKIPILYQVFRC